MSIVWSRRLSCESLKIVVQKRQKISRIYCIRSGTGEMLRPQQRSEQDAALTNLD